MWVAYLARLVYHWPREFIKQATARKAHGHNLINRKNFYICIKTCLLVPKSRTKQNKISASSNLREFLEDFDEVSFAGAIKGVATRHLA